MEEIKELGLKVAGSHEEAFYTRIKENMQTEIETMKKSIKLNEIFIQALDKLLSELPK